MNYDFGHRAEFFLSLARPTINVSVKFTHKFPNKTFTDTQTNVQ